MMKRILIVGAACALLTGAGQAWAQPAPGGPDRGGDRMERPDAGRDRDGRGWWGRGDRDHWHAYRDGEGPWGSREDESGRGGRGRGAGFRLQSGDTRLEVRCSPDESMRACVEAATTLLDRARSSSNTSASTTPPAPPAPAAPPR